MPDEEILEAMETRGRTFVQIIEETFAEASGAAEAETREEEVRTAEAEDRTPGTR